MVELKSLRKSGTEQCDNATGEDPSIDPPVIGNSFQETRSPEDVLNLQTKERIIVEFNSEGKPIGVEAVQFRHFCGVLARDGLLCPLNYTDWRKMPTKYKEKMVNVVQKKFIMGKHNMDKEIDYSRWILRSINSCWRMWKSELKATHYHRCKSKRELLRNVPNNVKPNQWCTLIKYWNSASTKLNRKSNMAGYEKKTKVTKISTCQNKKEHITIPTLPDAIFFDILTRLPAQCLYDSLRCVCSSWASIIGNHHFVETHLRQSKFGLLVQRRSAPYGSHFLELEDNGVIKKSEMWTKSEYRALDSSGGLLLFHGTVSNPGYYVANFVTKRAVGIPDFPVSFLQFRGQCGHKKLCTRLGMARVPRTGECKLAGVALSCDDDAYVIKFSVYTVGIDKSWRIIYGLNTDYSNMPVQLVPISVEKFIFWTERGKTSKVIAMDMDNESIHLVCSPHGRHYSSDYLKMGNCLSCVVYGRCIYYMHVLADVNSGKWVLTHKFALELPSEFYTTLFICFLCDSQELILGSASSFTRKWSYFAFSFKTQTLRCISDIDSLSLVFVHSNTLVSWKIPL